MLEYLDAVSVHPYRNPHKPAGDGCRRLSETADADRALRAAVEEGPASPFSAASGGIRPAKRGVSLETQAAFAARQQLSNLLNGVPLSIWYDWKNDGPDPNENEHNFGTVLPDLEPKPAYVAIQTLTRELVRLSHRAARSLPSDKDYVLLCTNQAGGQKLAAWTLGEPHPVSLEISLKGETKPAVVSGSGERSTPKIDSGRLSLELGARTAVRDTGRGRPEVKRRRYFFPSRGTEQMTRVPRGPSPLISSDAPMRLAR